MAGWNPFRKKLTMRINKKYDTEMTKDLKKGDVLLYRIMQKGDFISRIVNNVIAQFTDSVYFHVEIYVGDGWSVTAGKHGVHFSDSIIHVSNFDALRFKGGLSEEQADIITLNCYKQVGKPYDYLATLLMPFASRKAILRRSANEAWMCSELTAWCYRRANIDLVPHFEKVANISPMDIACSGELEYIGSWYEGQRVADGQLHVRNSYQKEPGAISKFITNRIIKPRSSRDDFYNQLQKDQEGMLQNSEKI